MPVTAPYDLESPPWAVITKAGRGDLLVTVVDGRVWTSLVKSPGKPFRVVESVGLQPAAKDFYFEVKADPYGPRQWLLRAREEFWSKVHVGFES